MGCSWREGRLGEGRDCIYEKQIFYTLQALFHSDHFDRGVDFGRGGGFVMLAGNFGPAHSDRYAFFGSAGDGGGE